jgi:polyhydroxybutyrate depolymerase
VTTLRIALALALVAGACSSSDEPDIPEQLQFGGDRPTFLHVPDDYDPAEPTPLLVVLHGYGANSYLQLAFTRFRELPETENVLMVAPDGVVGDDGQQSWHVGDYCCGHHDTDDLGYIVGLVEEISSVWNVDRDRVYVFGHSNGGNMSYYLGCEAADVFAGVLSLAGPTPEEGCTPTEPVSILHVHGTEDVNVKFEGGNYSTGNPYPGAMAGLEEWADHDGCGSEWEEGSEALDLDQSVDGAETRTLRNTTCPSSNLNLELWTMEGSTHTPGFDTTFREKAWAWLSQQHK